jgi:hypothetical protein
MFGLLLVGAVAYRQLPVSALPRVDYPTIQVITFYPGASPDVMASSITAPLERQFGEVPGLNQMTSTSSDGSSVITLQFSLDLDIDVAEQEIQAAINTASSFLPSDLPNPPIYSKVNPADAPILTLALTSKTLPLSKVEDLADTRLAQKISQLSGVGLVSISGGQKPAVRIQVNPTELSSYGITLEEVRTAIAQANVNQAKGNFDGPHQAFTIAANDQLLSSDQYRPLVIAYRNGAPVHISDVANIIDDVENARQAARMNQVPAVDREYPAPAGCQYHRGGGSGKRPSAPVEKLAPVIRAAVDSYRPHRDHSRFGKRRAIRANAYRGAGRDGDFSFSPHCFGHRHTEHRGALVDRRHLRRDVSARLQPEQSFAHGADHLHRLCRG